MLFLFALPASAINSTIDYYAKKLSLGFRKKLTDYFHERYLKNMHYYKICNLDNRISNPDQRLTDDANKWSTSLSNLYLNTTKPVLDIVLFSRKLAPLVGWEGPGLILLWNAICIFLIKNISPPFGKLTA